MKSIDRIEGDSVYLDEDGTVTCLPRSLFEADAREGDVVAERDGLYCVDRGETAERSRRIAEKFRRLQNRRKP